MAWAFAIAGLIAWRRRPGNRTGPLMIAIGFAWLASGLTDSSSDVVFTLGLVLSNLWPGLLIHLLLSYPSGRLDHRSRIIVVAGYADTVGVSLFLLPFSQPRTDGTGVSPRSASNLLLVSHRPDLIQVVDAIAFVGALIVLAAALVVVWQRWWAASPATRRVLAPMYATGGAAIGVLLIVVTLLQIAGVAGSTVTFYVFCVSFTAIPVGYLFGILRTRLDQGSAVHTSLATLRGQRTTGGLRDALRVTLNDPTLSSATARRHRRVPRRARRSLPAPAAARPRRDHDRARRRAGGGARPRPVPARGPGPDRRGLRPGGDGRSTTSASRPSCARRSRR